MNKGRGVVNKIISSLPVEMHLPGHNFTGPGTQLLHGKTRLNDDLTYKSWSKPVNRVDDAAYKHDVCYLENKDTKTRNEVCDKTMLRELDAIPNPTLRERIDRAVVKPIIWTKQKFGMGMVDVYCVKCKSKTLTMNPEQVISRNGRPMLRGVCKVCGSKKSSFLKM